MNRRDLIASRLAEKFDPVLCEVEDESHGHSRGLETHYKVLLVTEAFQGKSRVERQRMIFGELKDLFAQGLHALTQLTYTPEEWEKADKERLLTSPGCAHRKSN